jgi:hypothetical protein
VMLFLFFNSPELQPMFFPYTLFPHLSSITAMRVPFTMPSFSLPQD